MRNPVFSPRAIMLAGSILLSSGGAVMMATPARAGSECLIDTTNDNIADSNNETTSDPQDMACGQFSTAAGNTGTRSCQTRAVTWLPAVHDRFNSRIPRRSPLTPTNSRSAILVEPPNVSTGAFAVDPLSWSTANVTGNAMIRCAICDGEV